MGGHVDEPARRLVSANEAAEILGIAQRSVRRRLNNGTLDGEQTDDGRWMVWIDESEITDATRARLDKAAAEEPPVSQAVAIVPDDNREAVWALHEIIEDLQSKLLKTTAELERERVLREIAEAQLHALPAGDPIPMPEPEPELEPEPVKPTVDLPGPGRSFWKWLMGKE